MKTPAASIAIASSPEAAPPIVPREVDSLEELAMKSIAALLVWWMMLQWISASILLAQQPYNIVLILADDLGYSDLACYGSTFHQTPHLDRLASRGTRFVNAYSASPLCSPTRASILTGLAPARLGITSPACHLPQEQLEKRLVQSSGPRWIADSLTRLPSHYITLAELLQDAGYQTAHLGKWHLGPPPYSPRQHGFAIDLPGTPGPGPGGKNGYFAPWTFWRNEGQPGDHIEDRMAEEACKFLQQNKDRPFFLNYWAFSVHSPWMAKSDMIHAAQQRADPAAPQRHSVYAAMIQSLDDAVGKIIDQLDQLQIRDRTLVVFTSDNGGWTIPARGLPPEAPDANTPVTSNAPARSGKASLYDGGTRVPMILSLPSHLPEASECDAIVQSTDLFRTLPSLAGAAIAKTPPSDGIDFSPALQGQPLDRDAIFCHFPHGPGDAAIDGFAPGSWIRQGPWKLIRFYGDANQPKDRLELYHLESDPGEQKNLAAEESQLAEAMNERLSDYLRRTEAVIPIPNPNYGKTQSPDTADHFLGWKLRGCSGNLAEGQLELTMQANTPFLGFAPGPLSPGAKVRVFGTLPDGEGKVAWLATPTNKRTDKNRAERSTPWTSESSGDFELEVTIPIEVAGPGILRWYFPNNSKSATIRFIEIESDGKKRRFDFTKNGKP
jgi:arylsulfatase A-like enzyme